jgi:hypothetical protein
VSGDIEDTGSGRASSKSPQDLNGMDDDDDDDDEDDGSDEEVSEEEEEELAISRSACEPDNKPSLGSSNSSNSSSSSGSSGSPTPELGTPLSSLDKDLEGQSVTRNSLQERQQDDADNEGDSSDEMYSAVPDDPETSESTSSVISVPEEEYTASLAPTSDECQSPPPKKSKIEKITEGKILCFVQMGLQLNSTNQLGSSYGTFFFIHVRNGTTHCQFWYVKKMENLAQFDLL